MVKCSKVSFEDSLQVEIDKIKKMNRLEIVEYREKLFIQLSRVDLLMETKNKKKRLYCIGLRNRVLRPALSCSKDRLKTYNRVLHNGVSKPQSIRFVQVASEVLSLDLFQRILGMSLTQEEIDNQTISDVREFMQQSFDSV